MEDGEVNEVKSEANLDLLLPGLLDALDVHLLRGGLQAGVLVEQVGHEGQVQPVVAFDNVLGEIGRCKRVTGSHLQPLIDLASFCNARQF